MSLASRAWSSRLILSCVYSLRRSYSSMSFLALWAGDHQCYMYIDTCLTEVKKEVLLGHLV